VVVQARARSAALKAAASRVATTCTILFGIGAVGLGAVLICTDFLPFSGVGTGLGVAFGGLTVLATMAYSIRESRRTKKTETDEDADGPPGPAPGSTAQPTAKSDDPCS
jgi:hypothetical protein